MLAFSGDSVLVVSLDKRLGRPCLRASLEHQFTKADACDATRHVILTLISYLCPAKNVTLRRVRFELTRVIPIGLKLQQKHSLKSDALDRSANDADARNYAVSFINDILWQAPRTLRTSTSPVLRLPDS